MRGSLAVTASLVPLVLGCSGSCLGGGGTGGSSGSGKVTIGGAVYDLDQVQLQIHEDFWQIEGTEPNIPDDCANPIMGVFLFADLPQVGAAPESLSQQTFPIEWTGDGDDAPVGFCSADAFWVSDGATLTFQEVTADRFTATFSGSFDKYSAETGNKATLPDAIAAHLSGPVELVR